MAYATINDIFARYRPINTIVGSSASQVASLDISSQFIASAEAVIDGFVSNRYVTPLPANQLITQIASDLTIFNILVEHLPQVPDFMQKRYDRAMELLQMINSGTISIGSATVITTGNSDQEAWSTTQGYHTVFSPVLDATEQAVDENRYDADYDQRVDDVR